MLAAFPEYAAIIVNYNAGEDLCACLRSIAADLDESIWAGVVIDNASSDDSERAVAAFAPRVMLLRNYENVGFARAVNQGLGATAAPYVVLVNPDCRLLPGAVRAMRAELDAHPECALVGPRVLDPTGATQGSARGDPGLMTGLFGRATILTRFFPRSMLAEKNVRSEAAIRSGRPSVEVDWVSGACMLVRRTALDQVHGFDEGYFLYWEDADLCRRLRNINFTVRYVPGSTVMHGVGRSARTARQLAIREFHRSAYRYYVTHVAPSRRHPGRLVAKPLLAARSRWQQWRNALEL